MAQKLAPILETGLTGAGLFGNIANERARSQELGYLKDQQKALKDPTTIAKEVAAATQPLNMGLVQGVENQVGSTLAEQGLSQAPGIQAAAISQALAPFYQQNQNTALQVVMERLGLPLQYASAFLGNLPQNSNLAPLLALLQRNNAPASPSNQIPDSIFPAGFTPSDAIAPPPPTTDFSTIPAFADLDTVWG
jgi:hypothetical protein